MGVDQLRRVLGSQELARLVDRMVARLERGESLTGVITLQQVSAEESEAITRLVGRRPSLASSVSVDLDRLAAILQGAKLANSLREAVEQLRGPCTDRRSERRTLNARWEAVWELAQSRAKSKPRLLEWAGALRRDGTLRRLSGGDPSDGEKLIQRAFDILERLPCERVLLAELAACMCGDSHALDLGQPLCTLVLRALASLRDEAPPVEPTDRRALWESFGVVCDELSAPVLVLNLRGDLHTALGRVLNLHATTGEPYRISTRQLLRERCAFGTDLRGRVVYVCENVSVVAAAADAKCGSACQPLICIDGQPKTAACLLLEQLRAAGARLRYHGDFDWAGISIANLVKTRYGVEAWRMDAAEYAMYASKGTPLVGQPVDALWDNRLLPTMQKWVMAVHEELVLESLLSDLTTPDVHTGTPL